MNLLLPMPSADVKVRKKDWSNGLGATSGLVTYGPQVSVMQATPLKDVDMVVGVHETA